MLEEVSAIDAALENQHATVGFGFWQPFQALGKDPKVMYRFFLGCSLFFWQNTSGINAINVRAYVGSREGQRCTGHRAYK